MLKEIYDHVNATLDRIMPRIIFSVSPQTIDECAEKLNLSQRGELKFKNLAQESIFYEYCLFHSQRWSKPLIMTILEFIMSELNDEEKSVINTYQQSRFAVLRVESIVANDAITVFDFLHEKPYLLLIEKDAYQLKIDDLIICHLMDMTDFVMATGLWQRLSHHSLESKMILQTIKKLRGPLLDELIIHIHKICLSESEGLLRHALHPTTHKALHKLKVFEPHFKISC